VSRPALPKKQYGRGLRMLLADRALKKRRMRLSD
jgi:hypothetical protein